MKKRGRPAARAVETAAAFARRIGVNRSTICRAIQSGRLVCDDRGLLDVEDNLARWSENAVGSRPDVADRHQAARSAEDRARNEAARAIQAARGRLPESNPGKDWTVASADRAERSRNAQESSDSEADDDAPIDLQPGSLAWYGAQKIRAQNRLVLLGMDLRAHRRYPIDRIRGEASALGSILRSAFDRLADQTASRLALESSAEDRLALLKSEVHEVRTIFRREFPRALRRLRSGPSP